MRKMLKNQLQKVFVKKLLIPLYVHWNSRTAFIQFDRQK